MTNDGDLDHEMFDGITVGQHMCTTASSFGYSEISNKEVSSPIRSEKPK